MVASSNDGVLCLYDCESTGKSVTRISVRIFSHFVSVFAPSEAFSRAHRRRVKKLLCQRSGVTLPRFTHHSSAIITASRGSEGGPTIRCHCTHRNRFLQEFRGHSAQVTQLEVCPEDDTFISASLDKTVRFWDLRIKKCCALLEVETAPAVTYSADAKIFAVVSSSTQVKLYNTKDYTKGEFDTFILPSEDWTHVRFTPDGLRMVLSARSGRLIVLDAYTGDMTVDLVAPQKARAPGAPHLGFEPACSADSRFVIRGTENGCVVAWDLETGRRRLSWKQHEAPVWVTRWNPQKHVFATAGNKLSLWIPK